MYRLFKNNSSYLQSILIRVSWPDLFKNKCFQGLLFLAYAIPLSYIVFFAKRRRYLSERYLNIIPLKNSVYYFIAIDSNSSKELLNFYLNLLGNIFLLMPLVVIIKLHFKAIKYQNIILICTGVSLFIELIQYALKRGVADIDDIILNVLGSIISLMILQLVKHLIIGKSSVGQ
ncbi:VanZ family protein [Hymenobacter sp. UV11]|uniref:VanZ family protein n=1 Tax=Hymenobacter sp. UV11 TaxID=1849735 RepID=UPI001061C0D2|nr:VanZ family protein [Hymenobacter sp. UV11]TFZ63336.1 VanZ family protein [Hymenobacter sp. UV11]